VHYGSTAFDGSDDSDDAMIAMMRKQILSHYRYYRIIASSLL
jgi:hypothetical protein